MSFFERIYDIINCGDIDNKFLKFEVIYDEFKNGILLNHSDKILPLQTPSYAKFCKVVRMREINSEKSKPQDKEKRFLHSIAHIEYSAIDIALDAVYRFRNMPDEYYADWLEVAQDEIRHFKLIRNYMAKFDVNYGDFDVHDGLFIALQNTENSLLERMAVLPRYMEANGLDANAFMLKKIQKDSSKIQLCEILQIILDEEISHVSKGDKWFKLECQKLGVNPQDYVKIVRKIYPKAFLQNRELNVDARLKSGFSQSEIELIRKIAKG
ncbi:MAG: ferritin-like domain-containing protein [Campylobacter sp.]